MLWKNFSRFKLLLLVSVLLSLPVVFLYVKNKIPQFQETVSSPILDFSLGTQSFFSQLVAVFTDKIYALSAAFESQGELERLRAQTSELAELKIHTVELEAENLRLRELMGFSVGLPQNRIVGSRVIGRTGAPLTQMLQIDRGRNHGLKRGDAVLGLGGAVGQVFAAGKNYSDVLLVTDTSSAVDVIVQRTRARGLLSGSSGANTYQVRVNDFDRLHDVVAGDIIVTSGMGARFPAGVPVGEVIDIKQKPDSLYVVAEVKPYARFDTLEEVIVLTRGDNENPWSQNELVMEKLGTSILPQKGIVER